MNTNNQVYPTPGRPAVLNNQSIRMMAREGRAPLAVVAGLNALRHDPRFAVTVVANLKKK